MRGTTTDLGSLYSATSAANVMFYPEGLIKRTTAVIIDVETQNRCNYLIINPSSWLRRFNSGQ